MRPGSGRPERVGDVLQRFLEESGLAERLDEARVVPEWARRVGERVAAVATPVRVSNGTLFVAVRSSAWLMELKLMEKEILRRLNADEGDGAGAGQPTDEGSAGRRGGRRGRNRIKRIRFFMADEG
ncbi:MAG TPA: DUF721 domain-containing protein [Longimicrobiales bacterium]